MKNFNFKKLKILLITPVAFFSPEVYLGMVLGYFAGKFGGGKKPSQPGTVKSVIFNIGNYKLHLHHWLIGLGILTSAVWYSFLPLPHFSFGILGGLIFQGIFCYQDWHQILIRRR